ncbi:MAG: phosphodiester glycosidase family protein [Clostridiales bacterium]|nr:phosphodiester glycosidase family protein [Clostridiales bacterium]
MIKKICFILSVFLASGLFSANTIADEASADSATVGGNSANIVYVDMVPGRVGEVGLANNSVVSDEAAGNIVSRQGNSYHLLVSVNGGYFNSYYSGSGDVYPDNCPRIYSTVITNNELINGGGNTQLPTIGFTQDGEAIMDQVSFVPLVYVNGEESFSTWGVNSFFTDPSAIMHFTDEMTLTVPLTSESKMAVVTNGVVTEVCEGRSINLSAGMDVLAFNPSAYKAPPSVGDKITFGTRRTPGRSEDQDTWNRVVNAVSVGPMLVNNGVNVSRDNPTFTETNQQPDTVTLKAFIGVMKDGRLILGTVTASNYTLAEYLVGIGAQGAMSLDGGASTMLYTPANGYIRSAGRKLANVISIIDKYASVQEAASAAEKITLMINGEEYASEAEPYIENGVTMVPLRVISEALDADVGYNAETKTVEIAKDGTDVSLVIGSGTAEINGESVSLQSSAVISGGRTMVPLRFAAEALGADVDWDGTSKTVYVNG